MFSSIFPSVRKVKFHGVRLVVHDRQAVLSLVFILAQVHSCNLTTEYTVSRRRKKTAHGNIEIKSFLLLCIYSFIAGLTSYSMITTYLSSHQWSNLVYILSIHRAILYYLVLIIDLAKRVSKALTYLLMQRTLL